MQVPDAQADANPDPDCYATCPAEEPAPSDPRACCAPLECDFGEERCCGLSFPELECGCSEGGRLGCRASDACLSDCCEDIPCGDGECGPAPEVPNVLCEDGSTGGPVCRRDKRDGCVWMLRTCPEELCAEIECPPGSVCELEPVFGCLANERDPEPVCVPGSL